MCCTLQHLLKCSKNQLLSATNNPNEAGSRRIAVEFNKLDDGSTEQRVVSVDALREMAEFTQQ